mmetsp:Transcript_32037/g.68568  ORF Transcript_32037/g.68568 Transcript_32037/m.68568 type:complete len:213 (-) Transcript_32037:265-903(-)
MVPAAPPLPKTSHFRRCRWAKRVQGGGLPRGVVEQLVVARERGGELASLLLDVPVPPQTVPPSPRRQQCRSHLGLGDDCCSCSCSCCYCCCCGCSCCYYCCSCSRSCCRCSRSRHRPRHPLFWPDGLEIYLREVSKGRLPILFEGPVGEGSISSRGLSFSQRPAEEEHSLHLPPAPLHTRPFPCPKEQPGLVPPAVHVLHKTATTCNVAPHG